MIAAFLLLWSFPNHSIVIAEPTMMALCCRLEISAGASWDPVVLWRNDFYIRNRFEACLIVCRGTLIWGFCGLLFGVFRF